MKTSEYIANMSDSADQLLEADNLSVESDQDFENESTTFFFEDESSITLTAQ